MMPLEFDGPPTAFFTFNGEVYTYVVYAVATDLDVPGELLPYLMNFYMKQVEEGNTIIWRRRPKWEQEDGKWKLTWRCALLPYYPDLTDFVAPTKGEGEAIPYV